MTSLTPRNLEVFEWIQSFYEKHRFSPTLREIQKGLGFKSIASVQNHIQRLKEAKLLVSDPTKARTLRLVQNSDEHTSHWADPPDQDTSTVEGIPIEGAIAAGGFIRYFSTQTEDGKAFISPNQFSPRSRGMYRFALRVRGDSMIGAHILDGDIVIFDKPNNPQEIKNKTIVAARIVDDDQTTLKRWHRQGSNVFLIPENPDYPEIRIHISEVLIEGVYVGLVRDMF